MIDRTLAVEVIGVFYHPVIENQKTAWAVGLQELLCTTRRIRSDLLIYIYGHCLVYSDRVMKLENLEYESSHFV